MFRVLQGPAPATTASGAANRRAPPRASGRGSPPRPAPRPARRRLTARAGERAPGEGRREVAEETEGPVSRPRSSTASAC